MLYNCTKVLVASFLLVIVCIYAWHKVYEHDDLKFDVILIEGKNIFDASKEVRKLTVAGKSVRVSKSDVVAFTRLSVVLNGYLGEGTAKCVSKLSDILTNDVVGVLISTGAVLDIKLSVTEAIIEHDEIIGEAGVEAGHKAGRVYSDIVSAKFKGSEYKFAYLNDIAECSEAINKYLNQ